MARTLVVSGIASTLLALAGCASPTPPALHTRWVVEVVATAASDAPAGGLEHEGTFTPFPRELASHCAITADGAGVTPLALVRYGYYWHNGGAPVRQTVNWYPVAPGLELSAGMVVALEALAGQDGPDSRCPWVAEILAPDIDSAACRYVDAASGTSIVPTVLYGMVGPPGSASLDCPTLETLGWVKQPFGLYGATVLTRTP